MKTTSSVIRPGLLVAVKTSVTGGVSYDRKDIQPEQPAGEGSTVARWETTRVIEDAAEHERATKVRGACTTIIRKVCSPTSFGLLCPEALEPELDAAVRQAWAMRDAHNATARFTRVEVYVLKGRIADSDEEAARAIGQEVAEMISGMNKAIDRLDPAAIRELANKAKQMSSMLSLELSEKVAGAVEVARKAARAIVKRVEKGGEEAAVVLAELQAQKGSIEQARMAFLDLEDHAADEPSAEPAMPAVELQRFADLGDEGPSSDPIPQVAFKDELGQPVYRGLDLGAEGVA